MNKRLIKNMKEMKNKKKGFTLVELIIVIAIIAILAAMAIPKFGAVRLDAKVSNDVAAAKNIQSAAAILVANGTLATPTASFNADGNTELTSRIDGSSIPQAPGNTNGHFQVEVSSTGDVTVKSKSITLAPATATTEKDYKAALTGSSTSSSSSSTTTP